MNVRRGRNFLQTPGPTNIPDRILRAMHQPAWEYSGPDFIEVARDCLNGMRPIFKTEGEVFIYASNGHGGWEAALSNILSPGDKVLVPETGLFSFAWSAMAQQLGVTFDTIPNDWRHAIDPNQVEERLRADDKGEYRAVLMVHTETATGITSDVQAVRQAMDAAGHSALLVVDVIASLACSDFRMDEWGVDIAVGGSQKGLMCPIGLGFNAVNERARAAASNGGSPRSYWDWEGRSMSRPEVYRWFAGTAPEHMVFGLAEALIMLEEEGLEATFARHQRLGAATRAAIEAWSAGGAMEINALVPEERSESVTTIIMGEDFDLMNFQHVLRENFNVAVGGGLGQLQGKAFRIGHMGDINEPMILGTLASVEAVFEILGIPYGDGALPAAIASLAAAHKS
ncbi:MAG: aminotransferase class V-fold PLP-dependent enzyme [Rhodospirillaceae bacterium]|jgi:alanine-glyoxylate transaminase / serine-glyoxylate transaminase / serine-pyruvate transaminase|nr:aminotransferase class V-fold PLP-dependent enzyme [Rhodospirillaceae bacterium]MBT4491498.1 aminotransferase class V-fold PLP-dependent enzyme [Rhodospirillaceae bacterium]MBT5195523.1 aminotransferase class V-fold PLP-dependent enzyme [Rhodospirillaceae bacterium]MBT5899074.1 aminotransferase class V-fold PLP-dependent enzyme [Rhodospirillaceae bacterium]MBT6428141.1 aminotransferase class V-fold PLP-dependent enzyme [Rhodospirillaceae bacterium]